MIEAGNIGNISGTDWAIYTDAQDKFILGDGGSFPNSGGYKDACALGHFHAGDTYAIKQWSAHTGEIRGISEAFDQGGGTCVGLFSKSGGAPNLDATNSRYADRGNCGTVLLDLGEAGANAHQHSLHTWGQLYDNDSYSPAPSSDGIPNHWTDIGGNNVASNSDPTNRNLPPYISLYFIKFN